MQRLIPICLCLILVTFCGCTKQVEPTTNITPQDYLSYYPTSVGYWIDYKVDTTLYTKSSLDTVVYTSQKSSYSREWIEDTLRGFDTPYQFKLKLLYRKQPSDPWQFFRNYSVQPTSKGIYKVEDNLRFTKLFFPVNKQVSWKGNQYIDTSIHTDYGNWDYRYAHINAAFSVNGFNFDSTITVIQYADSNAIEKTYFYEIYAKKIGLIYAEYHKVEKQDALNSWDKPENGYFIRKSIVDWKK